jgi:phage terminase large subunit-like protein
MMMRGEWNDEYVNELRFFPLSKYKDQVDATSGAFAMLTGKRKAKTA